MKTLLSALALTVAVPAVAQTAPAADPHAQHKGMDQSQHQPGKHDCKECCEKMKGKDGKMDCMDKKGEGKAPASSAQQDHQGHEGHAH